MGIKVKFNQQLFTPAAEKAISLLATGKTYQAVSDELNRDIETVKSYATLFREVMKAKTTFEAAARAAAKGIISYVEIDKKILVACGLILLSGSHSDYVMAKTTRVARTVKTERRDDAITQTQNGGQVVSEKHSRFYLRSVLFDRLSDSSEWQRREQEVGVVL